MECAVLIGLGLGCMNQSLYSKGDGMTLMELKWSGLNLRMRSDVSFSSNSTATTQGSDVKSATISTTQASFQCVFPPIASYLETGNGMIQWMGPCILDSQSPPPPAMTNDTDAIRESRTQTPWPTTALQIKKGKSQRLVKHPQGTIDLVWWALKNETKN